MLQSRILNLGWFNHGFIISRGVNTFLGVVRRGVGNVLILLKLLLLEIVVVKTQLSTMLLDFTQRQLRHGSSNSPWLTTVNVSLGENDINFFQRTTSGFWVEEENDWNPEEVHTSEKKVTTPIGSVDENRSEHDHGKVTDPVGTGGHSTSHGSGSQWVDFWWVDPWKWKNGKCKEDNEQENTNGSTLGILSSSVDQ